MPLTIKRRKKTLQELISSSKNQKPASIGRVSPCGFERSQRNCSVWPLRKNGSEQTEQWDEKNAGMLVASLRWK